MTKTMFHYEILKEAGLAYDALTGEDARCFSTAEIELGRELTEAEYKIVHETEIIDLFSNSIGVAKEHLRPISAAEFEENNPDTQVEQIENSTRMQESTMPKAVLKDITVHDVEACPECQGEEWAYILNHWRFYEMCCTKCTYKAPGNIMLDVNRNNDPDVYAEQTQALFNLWNEGVAQTKNKKPVTVRIEKNNA